MLLSNFAPSSCERPWLEVKSLGWKGYLSTWNLTIKKHKIWDYPSSNGKMASHRTLKLKFSERSWNVDSGLFLLIWCDLRSFVTRRNLFKISHLQRKRVPLAEQQQKNDVTQQFQTSKRSLNLVREFYFELCAIWES